MINDEDDEKPPRMHVGDMLSIGVAGACVLAFLYLMFGPSPFQPLIDKAKHDAAQPVEVPVTLPEKPKK